MHSRLPGTATRARRTHARRHLACFTAPLQRELRTRAQRTVRRHQQPSHVYADVVNGRGACRCVRKPAQWFAPVSAAPRSCAPAQLDAVARRRAALPLPRRGKVLGPCIEHAGSAVGLRGLPRARRCVRGDRRFDGTVHLGMQGLLGGALVFALSLICARRAAARRRAGRVVAARRPACRRPSSARGTRCRWRATRRRTRFRKNTDRSALSALPAMPRAPFWWQFEDACCLETPNSIE